MISEFNTAGLENWLSQADNWSLLLKLILDVTVCSCLITAAAVDLKEQIIPDKLNLNIFTIGFEYMVIVGLGLVIIEQDLAYEGNFSEAVISRLIGTMVLPGLMLIANLIMKGAFGGGDVKLAAALGMACGWYDAGNGILLGILLSGFCGIILLITKRKNLNDRFPLGPFLAVGMILVIVDFWIGKVIQNGNL